MTEAPAEQGATEASDAPPAPAARLRGEQGPGATPRGRLQPREGGPAVTVSAAMRARDVSRP